MNKSEVVYRYLKKRFNNKNIDERIREEMSSIGKVSVFYLSSLISMEGMVDLINSFSILTYENKELNNLSSCVIEEFTTLSNVLTAIYEGNAVLIFHQIDKVVIADVKMYPTRGVSTPEVEKSVRGSKDSFSENLIINIGLIRRRIKSNDLRIENFQISKESKMSVCLFYLKGAIDYKLVNQLKKKLKKINLKSLIMSERALEDMLFNDTKHIVPLVKYTERPDVASINIIKGKMVLLVDTSSNAIITPISIFDLLKNVEEYKQNSIVGTFTKILRLIGTFISIFLVPLFLHLAISKNFDNGIIPLIDIENNGSPLLIQVIVITTLLEIIRIAVVHTPNALISAISLLAAILLGEVSIKIGLFTAEVLLVCSLASICNFASPSYELSLTNRLLSLTLIIMTAIFKEIGFILTLLVTFLYIVNIETYNLPYLYPIIPFDENTFFSLFYREKNKKIK